MGFPSAGEYETLESVNRPKAAAGSETILAAVKHNGPTQVGEPAGTMADETLTHSGVEGIGATVIREPYEMGGGWLATLADPEGNYFQLVTPM